MAEKPVKKKCLKCGKQKNLKDNYYQSNSSNHSDQKYPICKTCIKNDLNIDKDTDVFSKQFLDKFQNVLLEMNRPFIHSLYSVAADESKRTEKYFFGLYLKNVLFNFKAFTWKDSEFYQETEEKQEPGIKNGETRKEEFEEEKAKFDLADQNKKDVLNMLGYDPFETENPKDKRHLYNKLVDFLDEGTLEDGLKLQSVIEIVKGFNQIDKINHAITNITSDIDGLANKSGGIKSLIDSKKNVLTAILKLAEDNGISVKHNTKKSKGAGTLTGIIKTLQEKGFDEASVNLFDIETAEGIRQVADLSNQSIMSQLQFDENDYTSMVMEQRETIHELDAKVMKLEEENRLLKKEIMKFKQNQEGGIDE